MRIAGDFRHVRSLIGKLSSHFSTDKVRLKFRFLNSIFFYLLFQNELDVLLRPSLRNVDDFLLGFVVNDVSRERNRGRLSFLKLQFHVRKLRRDALLCLSYTAEIVHDLLQTSVGREASGAHLNLRFVEKS